MFALEVLLLISSMLLVALAAVLCMLHGVRGGGESGYSWYIGPGSQECFYEDATGHRSVQVEFIVCH